ncbi:putative GTP-binding protein 6 [Malaya genurostris]|uniref:putative GTP-binding protein 6 n=1 Tax=Malaya genurostris TaxID=325434 RepID=UPI0026F3A3DD|nr:putative GTP-binding protein 6 [Malaya genurostris]
MACLVRRCSPFLGRLVLKNIVRDTRNVVFNLNCNYLLRNKYTDSSKYKDFKAKYTIANKDSVAFDGEDLDELDLDDSDYDLIVNNAMRVQKRLLNEQHVLVIQPFVKWGPKKSSSKPEHQLKEAEALVHSIPKWKVEHALTVPLESMQKRQLFGTGKLEELKTLLTNLHASGKLITCIFISKGVLSSGQKQILEQHFKLPVMDRYSVVIQILRLHATSTEAKLQVAMAEIPYIWSQMKEQEMIRSNSRIFLTEAQKQMLRVRERKLKKKLDAVRSRRDLLRNKRIQKAYPIVAVVGYTNAGKTSLIKAFTEGKSLEPKNQLFATLDVTAHAGVLPCKLEVLFMDTVGFMADIPTGLIECFIATLEDAMFADVIVHVQDVSHEDFLQQKKHVEQTLASLQKSIGRNPAELSTVINVGNKTDLIENHSTLLNQHPDLKLVSSSTLHGIHDLMVEIERQILLTTGRQKLTIRVPMGGEEVAWLYKNAAVTEMTADPQNSQRCLVMAVITEAKLQQFRHQFIKSRSRKTE